AVVQPKRRRHRRADRPEPGPGPRRRAGRRRRTAAARRAADAHPRAALLRDPPGRAHMSRRTPSRALVIARTDLRRLRQSRDFWLPLAIIAGLFFVVLPAVLLVLITHVSDVKLVKQLSDIVGSLPKQLRTRVKGASGPAQASYALAVYLFA